MQKMSVMLRSDHLEAVIKYAIEQATSGCGEINPLNWGDNENCCGQLQFEQNAEDACVEILSALNGMLHAVQASRGDYHCDLMVVPRPAAWDEPVAIVYK